MGCYVYVLPHPLAAVSGDDGSYRLEGVPPGVHSLEVWHETLGTRHVEVVVKPGEVVEQGFAFRKQ